VSHTQLQDPKLYRVAYLIDQEFTAAQQANVCCCGGVSFRQSCVTGSFRFRFVLPG